MVHVSMMCPSTNPPSCPYGEVFHEMFLGIGFNIFPYFKPQFLEKFHGNAIHAHSFMLWETKSCYVYVKGRKLS
jgi:hypothetical protein